MMQLTDFDRCAIRNVIEGQLQAFQIDDANTAFAFTSPGIQQQFGRPENFMLMVKLGYPPIYRPRSVLFDQLTFFDDHLTQTVFLLDINGTPVRALYLMQKQPNHTWKINGCYITSIQ